MDTKREEYLAAKEKVADLLKRSDALREQIWKADLEVRNSVGHLLDSYNQALKKAEQESNALIAPLREEYSRVWADYSNAEYQFSRMTIYCDHHESDGSWAIELGGGFQEVGDKDVLRCRICDEEWR